MSKFYIKTFGCKVNQYDLAYLAELLIKAQWQASNLNFHYYIINTCAATQVAINKQLGFIKKAIKNYPQAKIVVIGCLVKTYSLNIKDAYLIHSGEIIDLVHKLSGLNLEPGLDFVLNEKNRYFLKVADACDQYCSYCIIPYARGKIKSRCQTELIREVKLAEQKGFREIVLSAIHLGK